MSAYLSPEWIANNKRERFAREAPHIVPSVETELLADAVPAMGSSDTPDSSITAINKTWPVMDEAAYHGLAGDFVKALEPHTEADPAGILLQFLTVFGNMVGNPPYYLIESDKHHGNIFTVLFGDSAKGRKGTGGGRIRAVAKLADETWLNERTASGLSSGEGLIDNVRDQTLKWNAKEKVQEVADPGISDKRLFVTEAEFAGTLAVMERHGNTLSPVLRNAWDGLRLQTLTRSSPLKATGAHISIVAILPGTNCGRGLHAPTWRTVSRTINNSKNEG